MNRPHTGVIAGLITGVAIGIFSNILSLTGLCRLCPVSIGGGIFFGENLPGDASLVLFILSWSNHLIMASILGVILYYILALTGREHALWKGLFFGSAVYYINIAFIARLTNLIPPSPEPSEILILLGYHLLFGVLTAELIVKFEEKRVEH